MSADRRYSEQEIASIFEAAAEAQESTKAGLSHGEGLTLAELQQIGSEAGISPEFIARAASATVGDFSRPTTSGLLGFPVTVEHSVDLPGPLSDNEWDQLVTDLRATFRASGKVSGSGSLREWRNGNLHVHLEPTTIGHRLRLRTTKGNAGQSLIGGSVLAAMGLMFLIMRIVSGDLFSNPDSLFLGVLAIAGLSMIGLTRYTLPLWARERSRQMEAIGSRVVERMSFQSEMTLPESNAPDLLEFDVSPDIAEERHEKRRVRKRG